MTRRGLDFDDVKTGSRDKRPSIADQVDLYKFPANKWVTLRIVSPIYMYAGYWIATKTKDGRKTRFYTPSPSYNPNTQTFEEDKYDPYFALFKTEQGVERESRLIQVSQYGYCCAIIRGLEKAKPARLTRPTQQELKTRFKEKESETWTPQRVIRLSASLMEQIKGIVQTNIITNKSTGESKAMSIAHPKFGMDIRIKHNPEAAPAMQYQVLPAERSPLNEQQAKYFTYDLSNLEEPDDEKELRSGYERWAKVMGVSESNDDNSDFSDDEAPRRRKGSPARGRKVEDDSDSDGWDDEPKRKSKRKPEPEDDWAEEDSNDSESWDDEEEEAPTPKRKSSRKPAPADDDDWDDDIDSDTDEEDDWSEDEEDDTPPPPKRKAPPKRKPAPVEDDWDDEGDDGDDGNDDWDDDIEEEAPAPKRRPASKGKPTPKRKPAPVEDDWDDEDGDSGDDDWSDDDEEEAPPPPKRRPASKGKPAPKRKPKPANDDDDWGDDLDDDDIAF